MGLLTLTSSGNHPDDELAKQGTLILPSAVPCSISPLTFHIYYFVFSDWKCTASFKFFDTQVPLMSTEELVLLRHAR